MFPNQAILYKKRLAEASLIISGRTITTLTLLLVAKFELLLLRFVR